MTDILIMCDKENRMSKEHEDTIARLMLEINRLHGDIATLAQEHTSMRARNERLEAESIHDLSDEEIYDCWVEADPTEYLPEMRMKDGSINTELITFVQLILNKARSEEV
jgi:FtsZ-binding cell division protein ZapB